MMLAKDQRDLNRNPDADQRSRRVSFSRGRKRTPPRAARCEGRNGQGVLTKVSQYHRFSFALGHDFLTLADWFRPSGSRRRRARIGDPREWPRRRATVRAACRRRQRSSRETSDRRACPPRHCRANRDRRRVCSSRPSRTGETKPMASSTRSALSRKSLPGIVIHFAVDAPQRSPCTAPLSANEFDAS